MIHTKEPTDPFDIVASALGRPRGSLTMDSAIYRDHGWDSFGHLKVILALEEAYGITIGNEEIERYSTMREIHHLYEQLRLGDI
jgi:acyl carrier protein